MVTTIVSILRGVSSLAPLMACLVDMTSWIGETSISLMPALKEDQSSSFFVTTMNFDNDLHMGRHASNKNIYHLLTHVFPCPLNGFDQFLFVLW